MDREILIERWIAGTLAQDGRAELSELLETAEGREWLAGYMDHQMLEENDYTSVFAAEGQLIKHKIESLIAKETPVRFMTKKLIRYAAAAVVLFAVAITYLVFNHKQAINAVAKIDVKAPETNKARITLGNGKTIYLDSVASGKTIEVDGVRLTKLADGRIVYSGDAATVVYNTTTNPRGSRAIDLELNDHSHVWLNAGSSITYPVAFTGPIRKVSITGEAYFEVAHDPTKPFIVSKGSTSVQVLGTHFNVKAYDNETDIKVTLLEGSVSVKNKLQTQVIKPGQQAVVSENGIEINADKDIIEEATAWMHERTIINEADVPLMLREIERWYNIETEVVGTVPTKSFYLNVNRNGALTEMLRVLEENKINYTYDEEKRKLTVRP